MNTKRIFPIAATAAFLGLAACNGADRELERTDREIFTEPATERMEIEVPTEDTLMVERRYETEVHVDTFDIDGADAPAAEPRY
jgi:hypothetical protein